MPKLIDMSGWENKVLGVTGKKTVVNRTTGVRRTLWVVCCKRCGATATFRSNTLRTGNRICPIRCGSPRSASRGRPELSDYTDHESEHLRVVGIYLAGKNKGNGRWKCKCKHCDKIFPVRSEQFKVNPDHRHACTRLKDMSDFENDFIRVIRKKRKRTKTAKNTRGELVYFALCKVCNTEYDVEGKYLRENPDATHSRCKVVVDLSRFENDLIRVVGKARPNRTASGISRRRWMVECKKCGKRWPVPTGSLQSGNTTGCSCNKHERSGEKRKRDFSGYESEFVRVLKEVPPVHFGAAGNPIRRFFVLCKACGKPFGCDGRRLNKKNPVTSCGCMTSELLSKQNQMVPRRRWSGSIFPYKKGRRHIDMRSTWEVAFAWACDFYGIEWIYEPEWFVLKKGVRFLPDFFLPKADLYVEVKGRMSKRDLEQISLFAKDREIVFAGRKEILSLAGLSGAHLFRILYDKRLLKPRVKACVADGSAWNPLKSKRFSRFSKALRRYITEK